MSEVENNDAKQSKVKLEAQILQIRRQARQDLTESDLSVDSFYNSFAPKIKQLDQVTTGNIRDDVVNFVANGATKFKATPSLKTTEIETTFNDVRDSKQYLSKLLDGGNKAMVNSTNADAQLALAASVNALEALSSLVKDSTLPANIDAAKEAINLAIKATDIANETTQAVDAATKMDPVPIMDIKLAKSAVASGKAANNMLTMVKEVFASTQSLPATNKATAAAPSGQGQAKSAAIANASQHQQNPNQER